MSVLCLQHRRLDIIIVPYNEFACALMYFTGSAHFNRSMRNLAARMNMSLNEHALHTGVVRRVCAFIIIIFMFYVYFYVLEG